MSDQFCNVCAQPLGEAIYRSSLECSLTSLCQIYPGPSSVHVCPVCAHAQSTEMHGVDEYYDQNYDILVDSEEEDQIYEVRDGVPLYRTTHQVNVLLAKVALPAGARILDYGCAKSSSLRALCKQRLDLVPHLFDVSERYIPFWETFVQPENWSCYREKPEWTGYFDVISSFFSLEHITDPIDTLLRIAALLKPGGVFYCVVPNVMTNIADLIVVDHVNHFTRPSLRHMLAAAGLRLLEIDDHAHRGAFVVVAMRAASSESMIASDASEVKATTSELTTIASFWQGAAEHLQRFEAGLAVDTPIAIYGAGFYGAFVAANLVRRDRIVCFLDQNPFLQGKQLNQRPILAPSELPSGVETLMVGLNPAHAAKIIAGVDALQVRQLNYFYL